MTMATRIIIVAFTAMLTAFPAKAATTIFASSVYSQTNVIGASNALFASNGAAATVLAGGELVLQYNNPLTGSSVAASLLPFAGPAANFVAISVGEIVGGVATFSAGSIAFADMGAGGVQNFNLAALCSTVSATGCSLLRIQNIASFGTPGVFLDGVSGVSNAPEPAAWALMMLGFGAVAWRMKAARKRNGTAFTAHKRAFA